VKIALVSPYDYAYPGGVTEHISHLNAQFRSMGHQVRILAPSSQPEGELPYDNLYRVGKTIVGVPTNASVARISLSLTLSRQVKQILANERFDVVHLHEPLAPALPITVLRHSRTVNVGTFHTYRRSHFAYLYGKPLLKRYFNRLQGRIAVSAAARELIERYFPSSYRIIPNGIDMQLFQSAVPPFQELDDGMLNVLFVGRLEKRKGLTYLLQALKKIQERTAHRVRLIVVGAFTEDQRSENQREVAQLGLSDVIFAGFVSREEKVRYYKSCHVFCAPSTGGESQGIVLLEAMAAGKPVVASSIEGYRGVLEGTGAGVLVPPEDHAALASALMRFLEEESLRETLGAKGLVAAREYSWEKVATQLIAFYEDTIADATPRSRRFDWAGVQRRRKDRLR
jgi:phosphatidylinositol alpha-mannosyltransferase